MRILQSALIFILLLSGCGNQREVSPNTELYERIIQMNYFGIDTNNQNTDSFNFDYDECFLLTNGCINIISNWDIPVLSYYTNYITNQLAVSIGNERFDDNYLITVTNQKLYVKKIEFGDLKDYTKIEGILKTYDEEAIVSNFNVNIQPYEEVTDGTQIDSNSVLLSIFDNHTEILNFYYTVDGNQIEIDHNISNQHVMTADGYEGTYVHYILDWNIAFFKGNVRNYDNIGDRRRIRFYLDLDSKKMKIMDIGGSDFYKLPVEDYIIYYYSYGVWIQRAADVIDLD